MSDQTLRSKVIRLAHTNPELRPHLLPLLTKTAGPFNLPKGFEGFDVGDIEVSNHTKYLREVETRAGGMSQVFDATRFVKPPAVALIKSDDGGRAIRYWSRKAWAITVDADSDGEARKLGEKVQKNLTSKKSMTASDPYLHQLTLYVIHNKGWVLLDGIPETVKVKTGPNLSDLKRSLVYKAEEYFGSNGATLGGKEGRYTLVLKPALAKHRGLFGESAVVAPTIPELETKLDAAIQKVESLLASR